MNTRARIATWAVAISILLMMTACGPQPDDAEDTGSPETTETATPTPTPTESAEPAIFVQPRQCSSILPQSRLDSFSDQGLTLLGGPGGKFGDDYLSDPTPERVAGGITCIWGDNSNDVSSLTISVAPLSPSTRPGIVTDLTNQGLNVETLGNVSRYGQFGDEQSQPAILNVLRPDSWISIISTFGGQTLYDEAVTLSDEAAQQAYAAG